MSRTGGRLFAEITTPEQEEKKEKNLKKGRNAAMMQLKRDLLVARYYYHVVLKRRQMHDAYRELKLEFQYTHITLLQVIEDNGAAIRQMRKDMPTMVVLEKEFPWMAWEGVEVVKDDKKKK